MDSTGIIKINIDTARAYYTICNAVCSYVAAVVARVATAPAGRRCLELGADETAPGVAVSVTKLAMVCRAASFPLSSLTGLPERLWVPGVAHGMAGSRSQSVARRRTHLTLVQSLSYALCMRQHFACTGATHSTTAQHATQQMRHKSPTH
jgi:hypothetical protein